MGGTGDLASRILTCLEEKPRSISEIARELDEEKYEVSKKIEVLEERGDIDTYRVGRSTACILADGNDDDADDDHSSEDVAETVQNAVESGTSEPSNDVRDERTVSEGSQESRNTAPHTPEPPEDPEGDGGDGPGEEPDPPWDEDPEDWFSREAPDDMDDPFRNDVSADQQSEVRSRYNADIPNTTSTGQPAAGNRLDARKKRQNPYVQPETPGVSPGNPAKSTHTGQHRQGGRSPHTGNGPRTIGIVSGKGGVGKTVVTLNLGAAMIDFGENVIVIDADAEMPNVGLHLGMYTPPTSLQQVVEQDMHIMSAMQVDKDSGLRVIPTSLGQEPVQAHVDTAINMLPDEYHVLIDSPPGMERPTERVIETCDDLIFVTVPEIPAVTDTFKLYQKAQERGKNVLGAVVNMYSSPKKHLSVAEVEKTLEIPVLGVVEQSKVIQRSIFDTQPAVSMSPHAKPSRSFKQIAADITGNQYDPSVIDRIKGLLP